MKKILKAVVDLFKTIVKSLPCLILPHKNREADICLNGIPVEKLLICRRCGRFKRRAL